MRSVQYIPLIGIGIGLIVVVGLIAGVGGIVASDERPPIGQAPPITENTTAEGELEAQSQSLSESPRTYAVTATSADAIDADQLAEYGDVGTQAGERVELTMSPSDVTTVQNLSWVTNVRPVMRPETTQTDRFIPGSGSSDGLGVQQVHKDGITGEGVEIGVISSGFDLTSPAIASNIINTRSFRDTQGDRDSGTSKAEIITKTAPDSQLHLVSVETGVDNQRAIDYLNSQEVDIIVTGFVWYYPEDDGEHFLSDEINEATADGTLVVTQPGDYAQTHWEGEFRDTDEDDFHEWTESQDELNALPDTDSDFSGGNIQVTVRWEDEGDLSNYKPYLYNPVTEEYIAEGEAFDENGDILDTETNHYAFLSADVDQQPLSVVIEHIQGPADDEIEVTVVEPLRLDSIERNIPASSIHAPGDVPAALTVGAYDREENQLAPYSSRGPTDDGRTGVDVTGYTDIEVTNRLEDDGEFGGTFAAAPYAGGVAALVEDAQRGDQSPTELTSTLKSASDDIQTIGIDTASGAGVVNAADAVDADITIGGITSSDVTLSDSTPSPGSNVTVTVTATPENGNVGFRFSHEFNQSVATASAPTAQIGGISVDPSISSASQNGATVILGADDVTAGEQITIEYTITTAETAGKTVSLTGSVTNGDTQEQELPEISYTTTDTDTENTGFIVGDIARIDGSAIENVEQLEIQLFREGVEVTGDPPNSPVQADANGEYTAEVPVASGGSSYTVEVSSPRFVKFAREVTIQPQATERVDIRLQESSTSAIDTTRSLTSTEVTNGSTVTVTVSANFESSIDDAKVVDNINGQGISADNLTITDAAGAAFPAVTSDPQPAVDITWNSQLGGPLDSDSVTVEYELTIPEDTPVGTTITFDGTVTNVETDGTAGIDGDSSVEIVATTSPDTVTVGGREIPTEFTSETNNGDRTVTADNAVEAINTFIAGDVSADVAVTVINAFIAS